MTELKRATGGSEVGATKATAHLPGLDIEILHRWSADGDSEEISIKLRATPSFDAFARLLDAANPLTFWAEAARLAWAPWLAATQVIMPGAIPGSLLPKPGPRPGGQGGGQGPGRATD